jgi:hypothetical protein
MTAVEVSSPEARGKKYRNFGEGSLPLGKFAVSHPSEAAPLMGEGLPPMDECSLPRQLLA